MKILGKLVFSLAAAGVIAPAFAFAPAPVQDHRDWHDDRHDDHHDNRHDDRRDHHDNGNHYGHDNHRGDWHPGPGGHWERGHRYDGRVVIVNDYRVRHLRAPPRGYHWVRADNNDLLLVAIATGIIADIVSQ
ncbi:RcnB family protein [Luteibacter sp. NPDC031894]|uniref:RcnB family protein n=1 Tax=Luteibacter sp. NPDC031894 TaxID=3390572 RepID=UPI003D0774C4